MTRSILGIDADDTLWHNESIFQLTIERFIELLGNHAPSDHLTERLIATERKNLRLYGYGIKGFTLSMIETAVAVADEGLPPTVVQRILGLGREMLEHPVEPLPGVAETLGELKRAGHRLVVITKGDLLDQEQKLARSGLGDLFDAVEIVSEKTPEVYARIFGRFGAGEGEAVMIGNSAKSDILPALAAGQWGFHVPYHLTWEAEVAEVPADAPRYRRLSRFGEVPEHLAAIGWNAG
ncbi:MAG: HAD family hydrolase [Siculibacillus sp.]|nr:HAD family hydrolase [Siculibacillus sp.]